MRGIEKIETDCVIIGGGPAGLTAAIYLARYRRDCIVVDEGFSRARWIKHSYNYPGFPDGIQGDRFLENLRQQATEYGAKIIKGKITDLKKEAGLFEASSENLIITAKKAIMATGVVDKKPPLENMGQQIYEGAIRFCPVCDGYEATDKRVGVMGPLDHIISKGAFLRTYTSRLFLFPTDCLDPTDDQKNQLEKAGLVLPGSCLENIQTSSSGVTVILKNGASQELDILYPALGSDPRSSLALNLGAGHNEFDCLTSDAHQQTSVEGLYAAGDLTTDLSQISVATGQAAIAATHIHNSLPLNLR